MGQKTDYNPDEWDMLDELSAEDGFFADNDFEPSIFVKVDENYDGLELSQDVSEVLEEPSERVNELSVENKQNPEQPVEKAQQRKIIISRRHSGKPVSAQEEDAFRKQIQDLFDLLELEKEDLNEGVRVYQTDSSPSMPWRFH